MKGMDIFCASPASTAICSSVDQRSMVRRSHRSTNTDHHHHHHDQHQQSPARYNLLDQLNRRIKNQPRSLHVPCSSQLPVSPRPYSCEKRRKSCSDNNSKQTSEMRRKSSADIYDLKSSRRSTSPTAGSSRYLLSDAPFIDWLTEENHDIDHVQRRRVVDSVDDHHQRPAAKVVKFRSLSTKESSSSSLRPSSSSSTSTRSRHQVFSLISDSVSCKFTYVSVLFYFFFFFSSKI